jgi:MFS family permease
MNLVLASEFAGRENAGLAVGYAATISLIGNLAGPPLFGWMADISGSYSMSWWLMTVSAIVAVVLLFFIQEGKRKAG